MKRRRMTRTPASNWLSLTILPRALVLLAIVLFVWELRKPLPQLDDAFISYHYADNLVAGHGLVFNAGEYVEGYTNLLWVLLVALGIKLGLAAPVVGHWLCVASGALLLLATYFYAAGLLPRHARLLASFAPLLLLSFNTFVTWTSSGLEEGLFAALVLLALCAYASRRLGWACVLCMLATLTRPEGVLVAALLLNTPWLQRVLFPRSFTWRLTPPAASFGLFMVCLSMFRWWYYADIVPNTFYAKVGGISFWWGMLYLKRFAIDGPGVLIPGALIAGSLRRFRMGLALLAVFVAYVLWIRGDVFRLGRFLLPTLPVLVTGGLLAVYVAYERSRILGVLLFALLPAASYCSLYVQIPAFWGDFDFGALPQRSFPLSAKRENARVHEMFGEDATVVRRVTLFGQVQPPIRVVASIGIGRLAYYGKELRVIDLVGLTDRAIARSRKVVTGEVLLLPGHQRTDSDYVLDLGPDFIDIPRMGAAKFRLPAIVDLWENPRLEREYHWDGLLSGYRRNQ
jgi:arabinofuranosyltransferase